MCGERDRQATFGQVASAVLWSFFGIRKRAEGEADRLAHEHVVGDHHRAARCVLLARSEGREDGGHEVVGLHALDGERVLLPAPEPQHRQ